MMVSLLSFLLSVGSLFAVAGNDAPNIIMILLDDIGFNDLGYNSELSQIPTPNIDALTRHAGSVHFTQYYVHSLCTPSRASLMTGRYHVNTGLTNVLVPGTPIGLPLDIPTIPEILKAKAGYRTAMSGKWHLGNAQMKQTPTGRGFDEFEGMFMWDCDYYTKQMYEEAWNPFGVDWVEAYANGTLRHFAESRHSTEAIADNAIKMMKRHTKYQLQLHTEQGDNFQYTPLFLYIAFTAAHSPLQPLPQHEEFCAHIPHLWRRQFCGLAVGIDESIKKIVTQMHDSLGHNTVLIVSSDNGGSPWFGGMNQPLRGTKATPYEGGVRVPAFAVDFSIDHRYFGANSNENGGRRYDGLVHISDWLPTMLTLAEVDKTHFPKGLDGFDISEHIRKSSSNIITTSPRTEVLLELVPADNAVLLSTDAFAYRIGDMKYIKGFPRDSHWYSEPKADHLNSTESSYLPFFAEMVLRFFEHLSGAGAFDTTRITATHSLLHGALVRHVQKYDCPKWHSDSSFGGERRYTYDCEIEKLYNLTADPEERVNIIAHHPDIVRNIKEKVQHYISHRPKQYNMKLQMDLKEWRKTFHTNYSCEANPLLRPRLCKFVHPWIPDDVEDPTNYFPNTDSVKYVDNKYADIAKIFRVLLFAFTVVLALLVKVCLGHRKIKQ